MSVGRNVRRVRCPWGELSVGRDVVGRVDVGRAVVGRAVVVRVVLGRVVREPANLLLANISLLADCEVRMRNASCVKCGLKLAHSCPLLSRLITAS
jgi:hypothetical protein